MLWHGTLMCPLPVLYTSLDSTWFPVTTRDLRVLHKCQRVSAEGYCPSWYQFSTFWTARSAYAYACASAVLGKLPFLRPPRKPKVRIKGGFGVEDFNTTPNPRYTTTTTVAPPDDSKDQSFYNSNANCPLLQRRVTLARILLTFGPLPMLTGFFSPAIALRVLCGAGVCDRSLLSHPVVRASYL
jgi:hypothetical protein